MDQDTFFIASFDAASAWGDPGAPVPGRKRCRPEWAAANGRGAGIPSRRTVTGCVLMLESLVLALVRRITLNEAAAILRNCDALLWRLAEPEPDSGSIPANSPQSRGPKCQNLCYDLQSSFTLQWVDGAVEQVRGAQGVQGKLPWEGVDANAMAFATALLAAIEALIEASGEQQGQSEMKKSSARGKVSAEAAMIGPSRSRAPPRANCPVRHREEAKPIFGHPIHSEHTPKTACIDLLQNGNQQTARLLYPSDSRGCPQGETT